MVVGIQAWQSRVTGVLAKPVKVWDNTMQALNGWRLMVRSATRLVTAP